MKRKSIFESIRPWPAWQKLALGLVLSSIAAYYSVEVMLTVLGQATAVLIDPFGAAVTIIALSVSGAIGLLFDRPLIVGCIFAVIGEVFILQFALRSTGSPMTWIRQGLFYAMPAFSGLLLERWRNAIRG